MKNRKSDLAELQVRAIVAIVEAIDPDREDGPCKALNRIRMVLGGGCWCPGCGESLEQYGIGEPTARECTACGWKEVN